MADVLLNGEWDGRPAADSRGLAYGDGLFETIRWVGDQAPLWPLHMARLQAGCQALGLNAPDVEQLQQEARKLLQKNGDGVIKILLWRRSAGRGYFGSERRCERLLQWFQQPAAAAGLQLVLLSLRLARQPRLAGLKHLNRLEQVLAANELESHSSQSNEVMDGLLLDEAGQMIEAVSSNLFLVSNDAVVTPELTHCGVAGVLRQALLERSPGPLPGIEVATASLAINDLESADEVFLANSVRGVIPVLGFQQHRWAVGPVTRAVDAWYQQLFNVEDTAEC